jgi:hypothetical protein
MGFAPRWGGSQAVAAVLVENGIRLGVPGSIAAGAFGGYVIGDSIGGD